MNIIKDVDLTPYNTFGVKAHAQYFVALKAEDDLLHLINDSFYNSLNKLYLGSGSNILFVNDFKGLVLRNEIKGITLINETAVEVIVKVGSGEIWSDFVPFSLNQGWYGLENLSLIPGTVGAAPVQNIGAYGVEVKDFIEKVEYFDFQEGMVKTISAKDCLFSYRSSIFKQNSAAQQWLITGVYFRLTKTPKVNVSYNALASALNKLNLVNPTPQEIARVVIDIRNSKLPNPKIIGNAGSFFKNPVISQRQFEKLIKKYPKIVTFPAGDNEVKVAAGWLIDHCGFKGLRDGACGVHKDQALVLVNWGGATGYEILKLSEKISEKISEKFQIVLEPEVTIIR